MQDEFARLPYDCPLFASLHAQYGEYARQRNVILFQGFRTPEDMRLFYCGFWLNLATLPAKAQPNASPMASAAVP